MSHCFNLLEVFGRGRVLERYDLDATTVDDMLVEVERLARGPIAESYEEPDRNPPRRKVTMPEAFKRSHHAYMEVGAGGGGRRQGGAEHDPPADERPLVAGLLPAACREVLE